MGRGGREATGVQGIGCGIARGTAVPGCIGAATAGAKLLEPLRRWAEAPHGR